MSDRFFEMAEPRDLLSKAKRDFARMKAELSTDNIFNFFVTVYHVMDYVKVQRLVTDNGISKMYADQDFETCKSICNQGKHLKHRAGDPMLSIESAAGTFGSECFGSVGFGGGGGTAYHTVVAKGQRVNVLELGERMVLKWEKFFSNNGI